MPLVKFVNEVKMIGNQKVITMLNQLLISEFSAVNQYLFNAEFWKNNGFEKLYNYFFERANDERKHSEILTEWIMFLSGIPEVSTLENVNPSTEISGQLQNDLAAENKAVKDYSDGIVLCFKEGDHATRQVLEKILMDEIEHVDEIEASQYQIIIMNKENFLSIMR